MFDEVSTHYDRTNTVLSMGNATLWRVATTRAVAPRAGEKILDVAAGTGTSSASLARNGASVVAADFSEGMIEVGRQRQADNPYISFVQADATALPFADGTFDAVTISFGLRNIVDPRAALAEFYRVAKPGGRVVVCEFSRPPLAPVRAGYGAYLRYGMPVLARLASSNPAAYEYLMESIEAWPSQPALATWLRDAGFERVAWRNLTAGIVALHRGWKPAAAELAATEPAPARPEVAMRPVARGSEVGKLEVGKAAAGGLAAGGRETAEAEAGGLETGKPEAAETDKPEAGEAEASKAETGEAGAGEAEATKADADKPEVGKPAVGGKPAAEKSSVAKAAGSSATASRTGATKSTREKAVASRAAAADAAVKKPSTPKTDASTSAASATASAAPVSAAPAVTAPEVPVAKKPAASKPGTGSPSAPGVVAEKRAAATSPAPKPASSDRAAKPKPAPAPAPAPAPDARSARGAGSEDSATAVPSEGE